MVSFVLFHPIEVKKLKKQDNYLGIEFVNCLKHREIEYKRRSVVARIHWVLSFRFFYKHLNALKKSGQNVVCIIDGDNFWMTYIRILVCKCLKIQLFYLRSEDFFYGRSPSIYMILKESVWHRLITPKIDHTFVISSALVAYYKDVSKRLNKKVPISILNMIVEPDAVATNPVKQGLDIFKDKIAIVYVGSMYGDKDGVYILIEAFSKIMMDYPDSILVVVGDNSRNDRMGKIHEAMTHVGDKERVVFTGQVSRDEVNAIINNAYCLALSRPNNVQAKYGFPTKLGEYLATGRPVVITSVGDIPLFLKDQENAYVSNPDSVEDFALKLSDCLSDHVKANAVGENGQKLVYKEFNYLEGSKVITKATQ
jgi:glycosyltransferase involved in cell wall biosynthesis